MRSKHDAHFAGMWAAQCARNDRWKNNLAPDTGVVQPALRKDAAVAPQMNSEPGNQERDKRAMYRPAHGASHSASAIPDPTDPSTGSRGPLTSITGANAFISNDVGCAAKALSSHPRPVTKYRNVKTDGYASAKEAKRAAELQLLEKAGAIRNLREQVPFLLIPAQEGERACYYIADFVYEDEPKHAVGPLADWHTVVEDAKGVRTDVYRIKRKLMLFVHKIKIKET